MAAPLVRDQMWHRFQDRAEAPAVPLLARRYRPADLGQLRDAVHDVEHSDGPPLEIRGCGSHWSFSDAAVAGSQVSLSGVTAGAAIETNDPDPNAIGLPCLNRQLTNVVPQCLTGPAREFFHYQPHVAFTPAALPIDPTAFYLVHVESGMTIWQLYQNLDQGDDLRVDSLAYIEPQYLGPWAMPTLGGAGGQTVGGVISTATHGGDVRLGPVADAVQAVHLVAAGDRHYWIERPLPNGADLVDDELLSAVHPDITVLHDADLLNAVVVAAGRMGVVYSYVLRVVRQFALHETVRATTWSQARTWVNNPTDPVFTGNHFVQIMVNPNPQPTDGSEHSCYVLTRTLEPLDAAGVPPFGRLERGVDGTAGNSHALGATELSAPSLLETLCTSDSPARAAIAAILTDLQQQFDDAMSDVYKALALMLVPFGAGAAQQQFDLAIVRATAASTQFLIVSMFADSLPAGPLGNTMALLCAWGAEPGNKFYFRVIAEAVLAAQQPKERTAIGYGVMDIHDYLDVGCSIRGDSVEVFFDASGNQLPTFLDAVLRRVGEFENGDLTGQPMVFAGYVAVRFMAGSPALLAMQQSTHVASVEIAGLVDAPGTSALLRRFAADAVDLGGRVHWGQKNELDMKQVERQYDPSSPHGRLYRWRKALALLTDNGRLAAFSTEFSRTRGLEVVQPIPGSLVVAPAHAVAGSSVWVEWDAAANPPGTVASLELRRSGNTDAEPEQLIELGVLRGGSPLTIPSGSWELSLVASYELNGRTLSDRLTRDVTGHRDHSLWKLRASATCLTVDGQTHWGYEASFTTTSVSLDLVVEELYAHFTGNAGSPTATGTWMCRRPGEPDISFSAAQQVRALINRPQLAGTWLFFLSVPGCLGPPPLFAADLRLMAQG